MGGGSGVCLLCVSPFLNLESLPGAYLRGLTLPLFCGRGSGFGAPVSCGWVWVRAFSCPHAVSLELTPPPFAGAGGSLAGGGDGGAVGGSDAGRVCVFIF